MLAFCLAEVRGSQKWGVGVVKNLEPGVILAERKGCLFSPVRDKICIWKTKQVILKVGSSI